MTERPSGVTVIVGKTCVSGDLEPLLRALEDQTMPPAEVLVASENPVPIGIKRVNPKGRRFPVRYLPDAGGTLPAIFNHAVEASTGTIIAFLKEQSLPCRTWVEAIHNAFRRDASVHVLQGKITTAARAATNRLHAELLNAEREAGISPPANGGQSTVPTIAQENFAIRSDLIKRFRVPFDERLEPYPNLEFSWRVRREGIAIIYLREMEVCRLLETTPASLSLKARQFGFSLARVKKIQDDYRDARLAALESFPAAVKWLLKDMAATWRKNCLIHMIQENRWGDAFRLYPVALIQRRAFLQGLREGRSTALPVLHQFLTPFDLQIFVTNRCNLHCRHCFFHANMAVTPNEIKPVELAKIIKSLNRELRALSFVGGEPFLCEDLAENCRVAAEGIHIKSIYIITNGMATERIVETVRKIVNNAPFDLFIRVSLDGFSETHNRIRGHPKAYQNALQTLRRLILLTKTENRLHVEIETTINSQNIYELGSFADFVAEKFGVFQAFAITRDSSMFCQTSGLLQPSYGPPENSLLLNPEQLAMVEPLIEGIYKRLLKRGHLNPHQVDWHMRLVRFSCRQSLVKGRLLHCLAGEAIVTILPNYDVALCEMTHPIGNLVTFGFDLKKLLQECFTAEMRLKRDTCYCSNPCAHSISLLHDRENVGLTICSL